MAYGILYGMGPAAVAEKLKLDDWRQAAEWQQTFLQSMPGVQAWMQR